MDPASSHGPAPHRLGRLLTFLFVAFGLFGCDHATKIAAKATLEGASAVPVPTGVLEGTLELRYVENDDIAFSVFHLLGIPRSAPVLIALSVVAICAIGIMLFALRRRATEEKADTPPADRATHAGLALVLGGALGNLVDRIVRGYVVDFIHVRGWPIFNVADIAVVVGGALIVLSQLRRRRIRAPADG
jgi:signal peptidase II